MDAVRDPIVLREAEISSFLLIWTLFARNDFEIDKKPYVIEKMIFFLFMGTEFFINKEQGRYQAGKGKTGRGNLFPMAEMILEGRYLFLFVKRLSKRNGSRKERFLSN